MSESTGTSQSSVSSENARRPTRRAKEAARQKVSKITAQRNDDENESPAEDQPKARGKPKELPSRPRVRNIQPLETLDENEQPTGAQKTKLKDLLIDAQHSVHSHEKLAERFKTLLQEARLQVVYINLYIFIT